MKNLTTYAACCEKTGRDPNFLPDVSSFPEDERELHTAIYLWGTIRKALNENWKYDPTDHDQKKYEPWVIVKKDPTTPSGFGFSSALCTCASACAAVGSRLGLKSPEAVYHALEYFPEIWMKIIIE